MAPGGSSVGVKRYIHLLFTGGLRVWASGKGVRLATPSAVPPSPGEELPVPGHGIVHGPLLARERVADPLPRVDIDACHPKLDRPRGLQVVPDHPAVVAEELMARDLIGHCARLHQAPARAVGVGIVQIRSTSCHSPSWQ